MRDTATLSDSYTVVSEILMPNDANNLGRALGGSILHWMDICAAIASRRFARRQVVTASMDHVDFLGPIDLGDIVVVEGYVFETGRTSMDVLVDVRAERPSENEVQATATSFFTMVALDDDERPTTVPDVACPTEDQATLRDDALRQRRERRESLETAP
ncbi:acyl-CoA thioesterase [Haladaptatus salinisoli]|uniref:acyl-CoA thioesterase n=1 Tax=Haladaptatus salinisoli TaxID=2884876 RepID=UPI001D0B338B|nr:acyl-CoA thioesterase [Haladaptatus salinisoli]